jgi:hypothetical protein
VRDLLNSLSPIKPPLLEQYYSVWVKFLIPHLVQLLNFIHVFPNASTDKAVVDLLVELPTNVKPILLSIRSPFTPIL